MLRVVNEVPAGQYGVRRGSVDAREYGTPVGLVQVGHKREGERLCQSGGEAVGVDLQIGCSFRPAGSVPRTDDF